MTSVMQTSIFSLENETVNSAIKDYQIEVINYDGESSIVDVEAYTESEALALASELVPDADICFIIGVFA